jgi:hypothetical protein
VIDRYRSFEQRHNIDRYYDGLLSVGLFLLSLIVYSSHWLTAPPGISGDASRLGLYAFDFLQEGLAPFYIYHQFAPHPLIVYLQSLVFGTLGYTTATLRGVTIVGGALATPAIYWAAHWLFKGQGRIFARRVGLMAALGLGLSAYFASYSRLGLESALMPVVELLAVIFLWRGLRRGGWGNFLLAGMFVGISQYVYIVARFFPVALALATVGALLAERRLRSRWRGLVLAAIPAALVALPQWVLFVTHPHTFTARTHGTAAPFVLESPEPVRAILDRLAGHLRMLGWYWEDEYNPFSFKPLLTPVLVAGLLVGGGVTLWQRRAAHLFSLIMMVLMLLPDLVTGRGAAPLATRVAPALPFVLIVAALGVTAIWGWIETRPRLPRWAGYLVPILVLAFGLYRQWDYATRVKPLSLAAGGLEWRASLVDIAEAEYIAGHLDSPILLPSSEYQRAPLAFLLAEFFPHRASGLEAPLEQGETITVIQPREPDRPTTEGIPSGYIPGEWVLLKDQTAYFFPPLPDAIERLDGESSAIVASNGAPAAEAFPARWQGASPQIVPLRTSFVNGLDLVGYQRGDFAAGQDLVVTLYWQPVKEIEQDVEVFVQLLDQEQQAVAGLHSWPLHGAFRIRAWQPGATMPLSYSLPVPDDLPTGAYHLMVGTTSLLDNERIPLSTGESTQLVETLKIPPPPDDRTPESAAQARFGEIIALEGYTLAPTGDGLAVTLFWRAIDSPSTDYTTFVHVVDAVGEIVAQADAQPLAGRYPTSIWSPGEVVVDELVLETIPPGPYQVYVGWYRWDTLERLPVVSGEAESTDGRLLLGAGELP